MSGRQAGLRQAWGPTVERSALHTWNSGFSSSWDRKHSTLSWGREGAEAQRTVKGVCTSSASSAAMWAARASAVRPARAGLAQHGSAGHASRLCSCCSTA
jgi:hypothetical protein